MKKRILFVDDEPMVLQGIQRLLRPMREEWEMDFADGGETAKNHVAEAAYDVVVTDMMMPGINGVQLLEWVKETSPRSIRLVLSGHSEQQLAIQCVGVAHQYLSKPCDADTLRSTVARVTGHSERNENVMALVAQLKQLPSIPAVYAEIVRLLNDPDSSIEDVGAAIGRDIAITAKVLQVVNSSFFGLAQRVSKPAEAASYLGMGTLKALVLSSGVFDQFDGKMPKNFSAFALSEHSQKVGAAARAIAKCEKMERAEVEETLVAGLLHDVGKLMLASNLPEEFERAMAVEASQRLEAEREIFGANHAEVGGYLLGLWGLPPPVVEAIALHHTPSESSTEIFCPLTAVHVANCLIAERSAATTGDTAPAIDLAHLTALGLTDRLPDWRDAVEETFLPTHAKN